MSAAERQQHAENWRQSGLSKTEYARQNGIPIWNLSKWTQSAAPKKTVFRPVRLTAAGGEQMTGMDTVEILAGQSVRIRFSGIREPSLIVSVVRGLLHAADH